MSDGHHSASVKVEAQEREEIKTPGGVQNHSLRNISDERRVYTRKGRVFIWLTDDARRLPVQIQLRMSFPVGTVTLHLLKEEKL